MRSVAESMVLSPPLVISRAEIDEVVEKARLALDETMDAIARPAGAGRRWRPRRGSRIIGRRGAGRPGRRSRADRTARVTGPATTRTIRGNLQGGPR